MRPLHLESFYITSKAMKNNIRLLLVDDDADDRMLFIDAVEEIDKTIECIIATDGRHALELLQNDKLPLPDFVFLDIRMPRVNGKNCLYEIKKDERQIGRAHV